MYYLNSYKKFFNKLNYIIFCRKIWFLDDIGNKYLDSSSGPMTTNIGYCNELLLNFILNKLIKLHFSYRMHFFNYEAEILSKKIINLNQNKKNKCFFLSGGSEASEASFRISLDYFNTRYFFKKKYIIGRYITNHGNTFLSLTYGDDSIRKNILIKNCINPEFFNIKFIQCYCFHCPLNKSFKNCHLECIKKSFQILDVLNKENIASLIMEPITGSSAGVLIPHKFYFKYLKYKLKKINILLISDEIVNAFLRIGNWFTSNLLHIDSDITVIGKGLGSGYYPISGIVIADFISKVISLNTITNYVGHTHSSNSFSTGLSLIIMNFLETQICISNILIKSKYLEKCLFLLFAKYNIIANIRIKGFLFAIETTLLNKLNKIFFHLSNLIKINLYFCRSSGKNRDILTLLISPQLNIDEYLILNMLNKILNIINFIII